VAKYKHLILSHLKESPASEEDLFAASGHYKRKLFKNILKACARKGCIVSDGSQYSITDKGLEWLSDWNEKQQQRTENAAKPLRRNAYPIKVTVLPLLLEADEPVSRERLFALSSHPNFHNFCSGLSKLVERKFVVVDKSGTESLYSLTPRGRAHAKDPDLALKEAHASRRRQRGEDVPEVPKPKPKPATVEVNMQAPVKNILEPPVEKTPIRITPGTVEEKIISIMMQEGAITADEVYSLVRGHDFQYYQVVMDHILRLVHAGFASLDTSTDPHMWYTTPEFDEVFAQNQEAPTP
jgi:DNA-binding PadR family transcriptional regulator